jgi:hypothetical protein
MTIVLSSWCFISEDGDSIKIKMHKSKIDMPFAKGSRDLQRCQAKNREIKLF